MPWPAPLSQDPVDPVRVRESRSVLTVSKLVGVCGRTRMWATACLLALSCAAADAGGSPVVEGLREELEALSLPVEHSEAEELFAESCASCHGFRASGSELGPPLVHHVYRPSHHADAAFHLAVIRGVRAHHWNFGDMLPVAGVTADEAKAITAYLRWLQRQAGIGG